MSVNLKHVLFLILGMCELLVFRAGVMNKCFHLCCICMFYAQLYFYNFHLTQEREFALEVTLSDESKYTVYRTTKDIAKFHVSSSFCTHEKKRY